MSLSFVSENGTTWALDGTQGVTVLEKVGGVFTAEMDLTIDPLLGTDGGTLVNRRQPPRNVDLPVLVSTGVPAVQALWARFLSAVSVGGRLVYTGEDHTRQLRRVWLQSVAPGRFGYDLGQVADEVFVMSLVALDPWWVGEVQTLSLTGAASGDSIGWSSAEPWNAALPWNGGASLQVEVYGDAPAFPVIDIYGPVDTVSVGIADGLAWASVQDLTLGQRLTVDHRPGYRGPRLESTNTVNWALLTEESRLWALANGSNTVVVNVTGDDANTQVTLSYEPRYLTP